MRRGRRSLGSVGIAIVIAAILPAAASASFHLVKISAIGAGSGPGEGFIELQMYSSGQILFTGKSITLYDSAGVPTGFSMTSNAAEGQNQRTYLLGGSSFSGADETHAEIDSLDSTGGAACFDSAVPVDCVSWGAFPYALPAPGAGTPDPGDISSAPLVRDVSAGCASALEASDDTNDSAADFFSDAGFLPADNASDPPTLLCPQTTITDGPKKKTSKAKARFKFKSNEANSVFECKLDSKGYEPCTSPQSYKVKRGKHTLKVRATNPLEGVDASPDSYRWKRT